MSAVSLERPQVDRKRASESAFAVYAALGANAGIAVAKFIVAAMTGSSALLSEAIHSTVDTGNELLLLLGLRRARHEATRVHPFGHGKELYFWGFVVAMVIFAGGGGMAIYEGIMHLHQPRPMTSIGWSVGVLAVALVFESISFFVGARALRRRHGKVSLWEAMRRSKDPSVYTVVVEDFAASAGVVVAFAGVVSSHFFHVRWADGAASIGIGTILTAAAVVLAIESRGLLVGESAAKSVIDGVRSIAASDPDVRHASHPLTMQLGAEQVLVNLEIELDPTLDGGAVAKTIARIEAAIRKAHPTTGPIFITPRCGDRKNPAA